MLINEVVRLNKRCHNVLSFDCGNPSLNPFLRRYAVKNMALNFSNTFVLAYVLADQPPAKKQNIAGYYRLAISTVEAHRVPVEQKRPLRWAIGFLKVKRSGWVTDVS